jgi:hypothetical protein
MQGFLFPFASMFATIRGSSASGLTTPRVHHSYACEIGSPVTCTLFAPTKLWRVRREDVRQFPRALEGREAMQRLDVRVVAQAPRKKRERFARGRTRARSRLRTRRRLRR